MLNKWKRKVRKQEGFTLVEIIAVLVILGILAAVAVPKYFDMQDAARGKAIKGAMGEAKARITLYFGQQLLGGSAPSTIDYSGLDASMGDFDLDVTGGGAGTGPIGLTVTGTSGDLAGVTLSTSISRPGI